MLEPTSTPAIRHIRPLWSHGWDLTMSQAVKIVTDQAVLVDLWLRYRRLR